MKCEVCKFIGRGREIYVGSMGTTVYQCPECGAYSKIDQPRIPGFCIDCSKIKTADCPLEWIIKVQEDNHPKNYPDNWYCAEFKGKK